MRGAARPALLDVASGAGRELVGDRERNRPQLVKQSLAIPHAWPPLAIQARLMQAA
jgi:hypothetical protein